MPVHTHSAPLGSTRSEPDDTILRMIGLGNTTSPAIRKSDEHASRLNRPDTSDLLGSSEHSPAHFPDESGIEVAVDNILTAWPERDADHVSSHQGVIRSFAASLALEMDSANLRWTMVTSWDAHTDIYVLARATVDRPSSKNSARSHTSDNDAIASKTNDPKGFHHLSIATDHDDHGLETLSVYGTVDAGVTTTATTSAPNITTIPLFIYRGPHMVPSYELSADKMWDYLLRRWLVPVIQCENPGYLLDEQATRHSAIRKYLP